MTSRADAEGNRRKFERIDQLVAELKAAATRQGKFGEAALRITFNDGLIRRIVKEVSEAEQ